MKKVLITLSAAAILFSCGKKEEDAKPAQLSPTEASNTLDNNISTYATESADFSAATTSTTSALNSLNSLSSSTSANLPLDNDLIPSISGSVSSFRMDKTQEQKFALALVNLARISNSDAGARAANEIKFGTYEYVLEVSTTSGNNAQYCSLSKKYYKRSFKFTEGGNSIIVKYPSKYSNNYCDSIPPVNNAIYTISKVAHKEITVTRCGQSEKEEFISLLEANLTIDNKQVMTYSYSSDSDGSTFMTQSGNMKVGDNYEYSFSTNFKNTTVSYKVEWKGKSGKFYAYEGELTYKTAPENDCDDNDSESKTFYGEQITSEFNKYLYSNVAIVNNYQPAAYIAEIKTKHGITKPSDVNQEKYDAISGDTTLYNKYFKTELQTGNGAKIGDVVFKKETNGEGQYSYTTYKAYLRYADGSSVELSRKFPMGFAYRREYIYRHFGSSNNQDK